MSGPELVKITTVSRKERECERERKRPSGGWREILGGSG
jgi:hypothetical protein